MQSAVSVIGALLAAIAAAGACYLIAISVAAAFRRDRPVAPGKGESRFAVLIPAHNEELLLAPALASVQAQDYPADHYEIFVVADNCSDGTERIAREHGVNCLVRMDPEHRGKGWALNYGLSRMPLERFDAVVIIDADNLAASNLLRVFDAYLQAGAVAIQTTYGATAPHGPIGYLLSIENVVENRLFYGARERLGLPSVLRGTGMCLRRELAAGYRWAEDALAEDLDYTLRLLAAGVKVRFAAETGVVGPEPETFRQAWVQRARWSRGAGASAARHGVGLLWRGLRSARPDTAEAALATLFTSKSALMAGALAAFAIGAAVPATPLGRPVEAIAACALLLLAGYIGAGVVLSRPSKRQAAYLALAPALLGWRVACHVWAAVRGPREWARTGR